MIGEALARKRLLLYSLARLGGLAIFFVGLAVIYTNAARRGGSPQVGAIMAIIGVVDALLAPRILKHRWERSERVKP